MPDEEVKNPSNLKASMQVKESGDYCCLNCGSVKSFKPEQQVPVCEVCRGKEWVEAKS